MSPETHPDGTFITDDPVELPAVLDLLIVGGGPAGTAAAFRAKELGISALVIDFDDLMKRIRDYAKDKLILPHFGGGDKMKFPIGGELVQKLHFSDIDKDDMCRDWKDFYRTLNVPAKIGLELTGLQRDGEGIWTVKTWNHRLKQEENILARHVVVGLGRGVPRRFDIPGNTDGVAYRLDDASKYVGVPVCVIGGGTSAAEAVVAISNAKTENGDGCPVYWSYRGDKLPKVSKALAEVFFDAYLGNGNIRYHPNSEPVAVFTGPDRKDYLSVRIDRKELNDRPFETSHLEFAKEYCIACIGEDIPESFLNSLGIYMTTGGPSMKKRMVVTPLLETQQPNVYLIGDILSQAYLEADDFNDNPENFREIKHRGNVKSALRDGVFIAEVVKQKLEGRREIRVALDFAEDPDAVAPAGTEEKRSESFLKTMLAPAEPPKESIPEERLVEEETAYLVSMTLAGVDDNEYPLKEHGVVTIGRKDADIVFPDDHMLAESHASISHTADGFFLRDDGSEFGSFLQLRPGEARRVEAGDLLRLGRQFLLFGSENGRPFFVQYDHSGRKVNRVALSDGTIVAGRQAPDVVLNPEDKVLSRRHISIAVKDGGVYVKDLQSLNHTYLRVRDAIEIRHDDVFRVGHQIFRLNLRETKPAEETVFRAEAPAKLFEEVRQDEKVAPAGHPEPPAEPAPEPSTGPAVTFQSLGKTLDISPGRTICDAAEAAGIELNAECHAGICGSDPIRIVGGGEFLNELRDEEAETLEDICGLKPGNDHGQCRLACMAKPSGRVVVERVQQ